MSSVNEGNSAENTTNSASTENQPPRVDEEDSKLEDEYFNEVVTLTLEELDVKVSDAVKKAISEIDFSQIFCKVLPHVSSTSIVQNPPARAVNPVFHFPTYEKEDKLVGAKNYVVWRQRFELDLRTNRLTSYITHKLGNEDIPTDQKEQMDATTLRHLPNTCSQ